MRLYVKLMCGLLILFCNDGVVASEVRPLNILFVVGSFPVPSQIFILNIITGLIDKGHNVSIFSFRRNSCVDMHPNIEKYNLLQRVMYEEFPLPLPDYDIVFCQFGYLGKKILKIAQLHSWLKKRKLVVCFRGSDLTAHIKDDPKMYKKLFKKGDLFLPVCDYFKTRLIALRCPSDKIVVHHSAIDCSQFYFKRRKRPDEGPINFVSVCRLVEKKGIDVAISAIAKVLRKHKNIHYSIVGEGPERVYLEKLIKKLNVADNVHLHGWLSQDQVVAILNTSHIFMLPSLVSSDGNEEGIANALKEAMAMGLLSIGTWHAGTPELIEDGVSGFLVPEGDSMQLAQRIEHIIEHPELWEEMQLAARKKIKKEFETIKSVEKLEKIFYQLLK